MIEVAGNEIFIRTNSGNVIKIELKKVMDSAEEMSPSSPTFNNSGPWRDIMKQMSQN
jgi:hypothetical protein